MRGCAASMISIPILQFTGSAPFSSCDVISKCRWKWDACLALLGREVFRARVTSYRMGTFEDTVIFVHDIERCLERLDPESQSLIVRMVFQDYTQEEAAATFGCTLRTLTRRFPEAIDRMTQILIDCGLLQGPGKDLSTGNAQSGSAERRSGRN